MLDLFQISTMKRQEYWICSVFTGNGAIRAIDELKKIQIPIYYPFLEDFENHQIMWRNYLLIKKITDLGILFNILHKNSHFLHFISDVNGPVPIREQEVQNHKNLINSGFYSKHHNVILKGTKIIVSEGQFAGKKVELIEEINTQFPTKTVKVTCNIGKLTISVKELLGC